MQYRSLGMLSLLSLYVLGSLISTLPALSQTKLNVDLTARPNEDGAAQTAREQSFSRAVPMINAAQYSQPDPDMMANQAVGTARAEIPVSTFIRTVRKFDDGIYQVANTLIPQKPGDQPKLQPVIKWYNAQGQAVLVDMVRPENPKEPLMLFSHCLASFPDYPACTPGQLVRVAVRSSASEWHIFNADGTFVSYWVDKTCYKPDKNLCNFLDEAKGPALTPNQVKNLALRSYVGIYRLEGPHHDRIMIYPNGKIVHHQGYMGVDTNSMLKLHARDIYSFQGPEGPQYLRWDGMLLHITNDPKLFDGVGVQKYQRLSTDVSVFGKYYKANAMGHASISRTNTPYLD